MITPVIADRANAAKRRSHVDDDKRDYLAPTTAAGKGASCTAKTDLQSN
jgi:hypothetical protein